MTEHRATSSQWSGIERFARFGAYDSCIIELRDRVEALEAAAQWGADQELEACLGEVSFLNSQALADRVRAARRPKPPSLKDRALKGLAKMIENGHLAPDLAAEIRAVLEMAPDE